MEPLVGTLLSVEKLINNEKTDIVINTTNSSPNSVYTLEKDRIYIIPSYQREIRWEERQLSELIYDIWNGKTFLGNVILARKNNDFEIIDGQQRITIIRMLIKYIFKEYPYKDYLPNFSICTLKIESFSKFELFETEDYDNSEDKTEILSTDDYNQAERYKRLWEAIKSSSILIDNANKIEFLHKLLIAQVNVIISTGSTNFDVQYFVDVNQKGVRLDIEDTLKGYLFKIGASTIKKEWANIKKLSFDISKLLDSDNILLLFMEQYLYCELYKDNDFFKMTFRQDFTISSEYTNPSSKKTFLKNTHIIPIIENCRNVVEDLRNLGAILEIALDILSTDSYSAKFKKCFNPGILSGDNKINNDGLSCIYSLLRTILKDSNDVPKVLAIKYIKDILLNNEIKEKKLSDKEIEKDIKDEYYLIFPLFTLFSLFTISATKKQRDRIYETIKGTDWKSKLTESIKWFLNKESLLRSKYSFAYKTYIREKDCNPYEEAFRSKSLAILYNFLIYDSKRNCFTFCNHGKLFEFIKMSSKYSIEHLLLNQSLHCTINSKSSDYPSQLKKYVGSYFNFIFIDGKTNGDILDNKGLKEKLEILNRVGEGYDRLSDKNKKAICNIECKYSKMILSLLNSGSYFSNYLKACSAEELNCYWEKEFIDDYFNFASGVTSEFFGHLNSLYKST